MASKIPPLLEPHLSLPPEHSLVLQTSVLGASGNWLVLRWLYSFLKGEENAEMGVVLCSFLRDGTFWRDGSLRMSLDLDTLHKNKRFKFVDGLTGLYMPDAQPASGEDKDQVLRGSTVEDVRKGLEKGVEYVSGEGRKVVLVLDGMDTWLAMGEMGSLDVMNMLLGLRESVHCTIMSLSADDALIHTQNTTLEKEHAALVLSLAHEARSVMALRLLDTGTARDVSGVLRITGGGKGEGGRDEEFLYFVSGDGGVKVFERGT